jgi:uncharacterized membrane protein
MLMHVDISWISRAWTVEKWKKFFRGSQCSAKNYFARYFEKIAFPLMKALLVKLSSAGKQLLT